MGKKYISTRPLPGTRDNVGTGFIIIPKGSDKKKFIDHCYRTGTISLLLENGGILDEVLITKKALDEIDFPEALNKTGSQVVWINQPRKQRPIAIGSISKTNEFSNFSKNKSALRRATQNFITEFIVDSEKGVLILNSNSSIEGGGDIYIVSTNKNKTSKLDVQISGSVNINTPSLTITNSKSLSFVIKDKSQDDEVTEIFYEKGEGFSYIDEFGNECYINADGINFKPYTKFKVGEGTEPAMLSSTFKSIFEDFTDILSKLASTCGKIQVATPMGTSSVPKNATDFNQISSDLNSLKDKFSSFQSQINFTD